MPKEVFGPGYAFLPKDQLLTFDEIERTVRAFAGLGVRKVRLTGGEPMLRPHLTDLVARLTGVAGVDDLTMTTNGSLLERSATALAEAGLHRVSVSLDSLDDATFGTMNDVGFPVSKVLAGIDAAAAAGLGPVKINAVIKRGVNDHEVVDLARHFKGTGHIVRFIEYMDVGTTNGWRLDDVVPGAEIVERIHAELPLRAAEPGYRGEVARRYLYEDGEGEIGIIASVSMPFCGDCTRVRLSADGQVYTCLFATDGHDLAAVLRGGASDEELSTWLDGIWRNRGDRYSEQRSAQTAGWQKIEMSYIGG